ncbi:helix-turn-helix domain-containing protein [Paenibacillus sp. N3.4]|uniref:helix-turn-helix domain-containing protein n=1 Tax=Paenibacillus sp. N3.4 TaxID=2603222 RepID=UPI001C9C8044|nr:helix-turn-helix domain-containing protein [Paenibacillus sp. N3.4]
MDCSVVISSCLAVPASATEIARGMGETAQWIHYHLKAPEKVGLARKVGTRQVRNLVEVLYQAAARTLIHFGEACFPFRRRDLRSKRVNRSGLFFWFLDETKVKLVPLLGQIIMGITQRR